MAAVDRDFLLSSSADILFGKGMLTAI